MSKSLPDRPNLDHVKNEAKALLKAHRAGDVTVCALLRHLPRLRNASDEDILSSKVPLQELQHAVALECGFRSWNELSTHIQHHVASDATLLHHANAKVRMRALRDYAVTVHPNWAGGTRFGWALGKQATRVPQRAHRMLEVLDDPNWRIRRETVCALAAYRGLANARIDTALRKALHDRSHAVQHAAARALAAECPGCGESPDLSQYVSE